MMPHMKTAAEMEGSQPPVDSDRLKVVDDNDDHHETMMSVISIDMQY